jgi:metal-responsive CopG/Arc/MetJ family transcriptional regulator
MTSDEIKQISIKLPKSELDKLDEYCKETYRAKSDVIRESIRNLPDPKEKKK